MKSSNYVKIQDARCSCAYLKTLDGTYIENGFVYDTCTLERVQKNKTLRPVDKCCPAVISRGECQFTTDLEKCPLGKWEK